MSDRTIIETLATTLASTYSTAPFGVAPFGGVGAVGVWCPTGTYAPDDVGIFYGPIGPTPDRAVGLTVYQATDPWPTGAATRRVQVRIRGARGDVTGADELADAVFAALHGLTRAGGLLLVTRVLVARLGADESDRQERADSYKVIVDDDA